MPGCPILTYHSQLLFGNDYSNNSHVGLAEDLERIHASGRRIVRLADLVAALIRRDREFDFAHSLCITFDDGPDFDWLDIEHPQHGEQTSFANLLTGYSRRHPESSPGHGTSFVIADPAARQAISRDAMDGHDWMHDHWWADAQASGVLDIESHGLDHRHPCLGVSGDPSLGHFHGVADESGCRAQIDQASQLIAERNRGRRPRLFAYPYGQSSDYLRGDYLPRHQAQHGIRAAVSTEPGHAHLDSDRWYLPRYVSLQHWSNSDELAHLLEDR